MSGANKDGLALLAAAATGVQVGAAMVATRFVVEETGPASLAMLRYAIGVLCLLPFVAKAGRVKFAMRDLVPIAVLGILQFGVLIALLNWGLRTVPSARASVIFATFPLLTMVLAAMLGRERLAFTKAAGAALSVLGVALALLDKLGEPRGGDGEWQGALAVFAAAFCGAACSILYRPYLARYPTLPVSAVAMFASVLFLAILAAGEGFFAAPPNFSEGGLWAILFIGVSSGIGYYLWLWALNNSTPTRVTVFLALSPVTATVLGALWLGETITPAIVAGVVSVGAGLWLALRPANSS
jgi:drug/metabolite transporter (DMT)-like permease